MSGQLSRLESLPIELLYEIHLNAVSPDLTMASRWLHDVFNSAPPTLKAEYIEARIRCSLIPTHISIFRSVLNRALRYPICSYTVFRQLVIQCDPPAPSTDEGNARDLPISVEAPRRLFRALSSTTETAQNTPNDPLPFLTQLLLVHETLPSSFTSKYKLRISLNVNTNEGYPLVRAVHAEAYPLIQFLLDHGAKPDLKRGLAVIIAIRKKNLDLVRMLIEKDFVSPQLPQKQKPSNGNKRRKLVDRCPVTQDMLKTAVKCKAKDIVTYFTQVKECIPDMETLQIMF